MPDDQPKPKIIIDEDWKSQVQAEKQRLAEEPQQPPPREHEMPPATFPVLISTIATQAMVCLGQLPNPMSGKAELHLDEAKHFIDTLQMLEEKTAGNRTPDESAMLDELLHELRMAYVTLSSRATVRPPA
jgi:hypothetical protein